MRASRAAAVVAGVCSLGGLAGCGKSDHDLVQAKVEQFIQATANHDYRTLCVQVLGPQLLARLAGGGIGCEQALAISLAHVHAPILSIGRITITGNSAQAITLSGASGQSGAFETILLRKTSQGWRLTGLTTPTLGPHR